MVVGLTANTTLMEVVEMRLLFIGMGIVVVLFIVVLLFFTGFVFGEIYGWDKCYENLSVNYETFAEELVVDERAREMVDELDERVTSLESQIGSSP